MTGVASAARLHAPAQAIGDRAIEALEDRSGLMAQLLKFSDEIHAPLSHESCPQVLTLQAGTVGGVSYSECFRAGTCVCGNVQGSLERKKLPTAVRKHLLAALAKGTVGRKHYDKGLVVMRLLGNGAQGDERWAHLGFGNLNTGFFTYQPLSPAPMEFEIEGLRCGREPPNPPKRRN